MGLLVALASAGGGNLVGAVAGLCVTISSVVSGLRRIQEEEPGEHILLERMLSAALIVLEFGLFAAVFVRFGVPLVFALLSSGAVTITLRALLMAIIRRHAVRINEKPEPSWFDPTPSARP
jgi:hypothetical protein